MTTSPRQRAAGNGESLRLESGDATLMLFRRNTGWGWGELSDGQGRHVAVLDHLGELSVRDAPVPMRLEADAAEQGEDESGPFVRFTVAAMSTRDALKGSSFEQWVGSPFAGPLLEGTVTVRSLAEGRFGMSWDVTSTHDIYVDYLRGPWVTFGRGSFGTERDDAILPGIEWARDREWTSGHDWFRDPWSWRVTPPVDSVGIPVMAVSHEGTRVSVSWDAAAEATGWFSYRRHRLQPVFAAPNLVERTDSSLLGLMIPETGGAGDQWHASDPMELHRGQRISFRTVVSVGPGTSLDAVVDHVRHSGLPTAATADELRETVHGIAATYGANLWHVGAGFGVDQLPGDIRPVVPAFVADYLRVHPDRPEAARLAELVEGLAEEEHENVAMVAEGWLAEQAEDGSFSFDPMGRHRSKDDFVVARDLVAPMGVQGDRALDFDVLPALDLLRAFVKTGDARFEDAARRALDAGRVHNRPEGGDYWETPLHSPNLLAAGHAAVAYAWAWQLFGDERDRVAARHWLRSLLVFTHLWSPRGRPMTYNTKPCLCSSDWYFANWVRDHVQWEVIASIALAGEEGVDLAAVDDELDWDSYLRGVLGAGSRWLLDHREDTWRPHNLPSTLETYLEGGFDGCLPDTHNSTTGLYGGMAIPPGRLGQAILGLLGDP